MKPKISINTYITHDLYISTHLILCGLKLKEVKPINSGQSKFEFVFEDPDDKKDELIKAYWEHTLEFPTQKVLAEFKQLKARLFISANNQNLYERKVFNR